MGNPTGLCANPPPRPSPIAMGEGGRSPGGGHYAASIRPPHGTPRCTEWPLIIFTVLAQMAAGASLVLTVFRALAAWRGEPEAAEDLAHIALPMIIGALVIGALAATFHLSRPAQAVHAMANLGASGLSREMLAGVLFGALVGFDAALGMLGMNLPALRMIAGAAAAAAGMALVAVMARAYRLRTVPAWDTPATPAAFFSTAVMLGAVGVGAVMSAVLPGDDAFGASFAQWLGAAAAVTLGVQIAAALLTAAAAHVPGGAVTLRLALALAGAGLFNFAVRVPGGNVLAAYLAFALVLAAEGIGRFLFFASYRRVGV